MPVNRHSNAPALASFATAFAIASLAVTAPASWAPTNRTGFKFDFGSGKTAPGLTHVLPTTVYSEEAGFGFDLGSEVKEVGGAGEAFARFGFCTSDRPFFFSVAVPEGNYRVTATFGDPSGATTNAVKAESRRLMLENVRTAPGQFATRTFTVNVRTPRLASGGEVRLKTRESGPPLVLHWDDKLTLEFNGARPCLCALEISKVDDAVTVYLAGDSTVTDQPQEPWNSWGQMLPRFFKPEVAVANHAESGESLKSFLSARRLDKILSTLKAGDYLFIQFGHNDQKDKSPGAGAFTTYKDNLKRFVAEARKRGGIPVLVTPMHRLRFDGEGKVANTLGDFPEAVRQTARDEVVPLIDLNALSQRFYEALGPQNCKKAFQDGTHHNNYGSYELARCVVEGIKANKLGLARFLADDVSPYDPSRPDPVETFAVPPSPQTTATKPEGN